MTTFLPLLLTFAVIVAFGWRWQRRHEQLRKEMDDASHPRTDTRADSDANA